MNSDIIPFSYNMYYILDRDVYDIFRIFNSVQWGSCRLVGGCIRNALMGYPIKDYDFATLFSPEDVKNLFIHEKYHVVDIGVKHGTVSVIRNNRSFEITTLRVDINTDGRHAEVIFTNQWDIDASRRDFSINALYMSYSGHIYDYYQGLCHIENRSFIFIGDPYVRIHEDYLRILRLFRFLALYRGRSDEESKNASQYLAPHLSSLSRERIRQEFFQLFYAPYCIDVLRCMCHRGILQNLSCFLRFSFSVIRINSLIRNNTIVYDHMHYLFALVIDSLHDLSPGDFISMFLFTRSEKKRIKNTMHLFSIYGKKMIHASMSDMILLLEYLIYRYDKITSYDIGILFFLKDQTYKIDQIQWSFILRKINLYSQKVFICHSDILSLGITGKLVGLCVRKSVRIWIYSNKNIEKNYILRYCIVDYFKRS